MDDPIARNKVGKAWAHPATGWMLVVAWVLPAFLLNVLWFDLSDRLWVLAPGFPILLWIGFAALAVYAIARCVRLRGSPASIALLVVITLAGIGNYQYGPSAGLRVRFHYFKPRYEAAVAAFAAGRHPSRETRWMIDQDPPLRIVFPWPGGILDNWSGVVYDPTGIVARANEFKPDFSNFADPALSDVRHLFGGDLFRCMPLGGHWYFCSFT